MFRVMSLHQLTQAMVAKKLLLDREVELTQMLPFNKETEVANMPLNKEKEVANKSTPDGRLKVVGEFSLYVEVMVFTEPRSLMFRVLSLHQMT